MPHAFFALELTIMFEESRRAGSSGGWRIAFAQRAIQQTQVEAILQKRGIAIVPGAGDRGGDPRSLGHRGQQLVEAA
jgi:hypothetical protein